MSLNQRYDFVLLFDVKDGNPNGDPDAGNLPRIDAETGQGLVTDVCLKRKIRNYVELAKAADQEDIEFAQALPAGTKRNEIYVREKAVLNRQHQRAYAAHKENIGKEKEEGKKIQMAREWMCQNFFDVRTFGAVMSTGKKGEGKNAGQVRGPVQLTFARSIDPVISQEHSITRMAVTTEKKADEQSGDNRTMGRKFTIPYGLYVAHGFVSAHLAQQTGFGEDDLNLLWEALQIMFEHDRSAARGQMVARGLYVFEHESKLGNTHAHKLFEAINVQRKDHVEVPRSFDDYAVSVKESEIPEQVKLHKMIG